MNRASNHSAFTLIELLIVIAIIAILSIVVLFTLNPPQLLAQGRDTNRISDMSTLNSALGIYIAQGGTSLGSSNIVYVSIPDPTATSSLGDQCQGLGLISLPANYSYQCASSSTYRNINGTGWIPVNFSSIATGAPISSLPIDPINQSSSRLYYTYSTNGTNYEVTSVMESQKYQLGGSNDAISGDGGTLASVYEKGSKLGLEPLDYGDNSLVGYWSFEEGSSSIAYDYSGNNATGSWSGTASGTNGYYSPGKIGSWAGKFDGTSTYVNIGTVTANSNFTIVAWFNPNNLSGYNYIIGGQVSNITFGTTAAHVMLRSAGQSIQNSLGNANLNQWNFIAVSYIKGISVNFFENGVGEANQADSINLNNYGLNYIGKDYSNSRMANGLIDDIRIYNRALTAAQIAALYAGGK